MTSSKQSSTSIVTVKPFCSYNQHSGSEQGQTGIAKECVLMISISSYGSNNELSGSSLVDLALDTYGKWEE
jgi:hypothetical protein